MTRTDIVVVVIGRNEGERLERCLRSIQGQLSTIYVDSGSTDGSVALANSLGVAVLPLDMRIGFTAARARNAGWRQVIRDQLGSAKFVQFVDGDCELNPAWLDDAKLALQADPRAAAVFGRLRERFPRLSIYNRMCDDEWNVPVGVIASCGGNALFRVEALEAAGGFSDDLIAGEEPDLCLRLARLGWLVRCIDSEMGLHDANIVSFGSWWRRTKRGGLAYALHVVRHGRQSATEWRLRLASIVFWGFGWPLFGSTVALLCWFRSPLAGAAVLAALFGTYAVQMVRIALRKHGAGADWNFALKFGALTMLGKFAQFGGAVRCWNDLILKRESRLIEYKRSA